MMFLISIPNFHMIDAMTPQAQIEYLATKVMGWQIPKHGHGFDDLPPMVEDDTGYVHTSWNPLTDWNHTMQVWYQLVEMKLQMGIDQTEDHATVVIGRFDSLGCMEIFVHVEDADAKIAICLAAIQAHKELSLSKI